jgi:hypothetical protein
MPCWLVREKESQAKRQLEEDGFKKIKIVVAFYLSPRRL